MTLGCKTPEDVVKAMKDHKVEFVDLRFTDMPGMQQHTSYPATAFGLDNIVEGMGFDGSSIRGFQEIQASDMLLMPDATTAYLDPFTQYTTLAMVCDIKDPITLELYPRDPRGVAKKAEEYLKSTGLGDRAYFGPEAEFFVFDSVQYAQAGHYASYFVDSGEGWWNADKDESPNLAHKIRPKEGYFPLPPNDTLQDIRSEMALVMAQLGIDVECHHHEVATAGQCEIDMKFDTLVKMADDLMKYKYVVKNVARRHNKTATFMPKPLFGDNGSGMHVHQSIWDGDIPTFGDEAGFAKLSQTARYYIGGLLKHAPAILAFAAPTTNSYHRLVPGYEAPVNLVWSLRNRSAAVRIPMYSGSLKARRAEFRCPDPSCNPYLAFAALLMAGLDGIRNKLDPGDPVDKNIYDLPPEEAAELPKVPGSLDEAIVALEHDHDFLIEGDVFTKDFIENYIAYKRENEIDPVRLRPHPYEFVMYYDI
jgi:glutamine synthetase